MIKGSEKRVPEYPIHKQFLDRWSPRAMSGQPIPERDLMSLFEAARWAPSSYNNQPWRMLYALRETPEWNLLFDLLMDLNKAWCGNGAALVLFLAKTTFDFNGQPSITNSFDAGAAWMSFALEGARLGYVVHGMQGFDYAKAKESLRIPDGFDVEAMVVVGRPGRVEDLSPEAQKRETPSDRRPIADSIHAGAFPAAWQKQLSAEPPIGMTNPQIAATLDELADLLEFKGENPFRVRAYRNAARVVRDLPESVAGLLQQPDRQLTAIKGIGKDLADKIAELVASGKLPLLEELRAEVPASVFLLLRIPGLGPKKAAQLHKELGINTLDELRAACQTHQVQALKGFGAKTEQAILAGIGLAATAAERIYWADADAIAQALLAYARACPAVAQAEAAGSYRRGRETIGDLDILVESGEPGVVMDHFERWPEIETVLGRGDTKLSVRLAGGLQVDLRVVPGESFGAALQYFTGSKDHNVALRGLAKARGLKINEYGVFRASKIEPKAGAAKVDNEDSPTGERIAGRSEAEVYATLGLPWFPPELREARREFDWAAAGALPELIEAGDLLGDLHMHTTATDGKATLAEMVAAARARGLRYIAITDHSQRVAMANGLNPERARAQWAEIDRLNAELDDFLVLKGIEVDILESGALDLPDDVLAEADWVVASVHYGQKQPRERITARIVGALANPHVSAIAHPTGRLINRRKPYEVDLEAVFAAAREHGKLLELNSNPARLDLDDVAAAAAKSHGIPIVIDSDAHSTDGLAVTRYGVLQARRAGLTKADVANTRPWKEMRRLIGRKGG